MDKQSTIVVTGAAGFIGSCLVSFLNDKGYKNLILVDDFSPGEKDINLKGKSFLIKVERENFFDWLENQKTEISFFYHIGARTDTTEFDYSVHEHLNVAYSKKVWDYCALHSIPLVYASSAATYGSGELGYKDDHQIIPALKPLNPYGISKNEFDKWVLLEIEKNNSSPHLQSPPAWAGLKFFNVYGPNEYHKARMASVIFHSYNQIISKGFVKLFKSHKEGFKNGEQLRDFIYVKDVLRICFWFLECWQKGSNPFISGIYNVGTGVARTFNDLVKATFKGLDRNPEIEYIDMPEDIRNTYQYYTQAHMQKLREAGYSEPMYSLENGIDDYVRNYLIQKKSSK
ncbi:MAG: ADP-glyceromanno-heptose 6-epimerase [Bacteroidota bacterium]|nr:ADP-glyceromanno-heptose 6-epimerase [Bacteroidota bacterium]